MAGGEPSTANLVRVDLDGTVVARGRGPRVPERLGDHAGRLDADRGRDDGQPLHVVHHRGRRHAHPPPDLGRRPGVAPDGCGLDAEGRIWCADAFGKRCVLVEEGGRMVEEIPAPDGLGVYACMLGGPDGTTLLQCCAPGFLAHERKAANDARLVATEVEVGRAGLPVSGRGAQSPGPATIGVGLSVLGHRVDVDHQVSDRKHQRFPDGHLPCEQVQRDPPRRGTGGATCRDASAASRSTEPVSHTTKWPAMASRTASTSITEAAGPMTAGIVLAEHLERDLRFERVQVLGPFRLGDVRSRLPIGALLEHARHRRAADAARRAATQTADGGLPGAHEAEEDDVAFVHGPAYQ